MRCLKAFRAAVVLAVMALCCGVASSTASNIYIAQNAAGAANGSSCANAYPVTFFNTSGNWGSGLSQIGPGTTVHLCGTITTSLATQGNGSSGSPITILFESSANLTQTVFPYYYGALLLSPNSSYIIVDGGSNGIIQNTANGSGLANETISSGLSAPNCQHCEIRNLTISNIFVHSPTDDTAFEQTEITAIYINGSNNLIHNNIIHDVSWAILANPGTSDATLKIYNNEIDHMDHGVAVGVEGDGYNLSGLDIYGNHFHDMANWDTPSDRYHHDGIHIYGCTSGACTGTSISGVSIYNNLFDGVDGNCCVTSHIYMEGRPGIVSNVNIFNNVSIAGSGSYYSAGILDVYASNIGLYNNTVMGSTTANGYCIIFSATDSSGSVLNNAATGCQGLMYIGNTTMLAANLDRNAYANGGNITFQWGYTDQTTSLATWQGWSGGDAHSQLVSSLGLNVTTGVPQSGSAVIGTGANLTSLGIAALNLDKASVVRPSTGPWDIGAYLFRGNTAPAPPTGLSTVVR